MSGQQGFLDIDERYAAGDPLRRLASVVDCEVFLPVLDGALASPARIGPRASPPCDAVLMFMCGRHLGSKGFADELPQEIGPASRLTFPGTIAPVPD